jgi:hypothetical protein
MADVDEQLVEDTHYELHDFEKELNSDLVEFHVRKTQSRLRRKLSRSVRNDVRSDLIPLAAAIRLIENDKESFLSSKGAADVDKSYDVEEFISGLRDRRDELLSEAQGQWGVTVSRYDVNTY